MERALKQAVEFREGAKVKCPKCGRIGTLRVDTFRAREHEYKYWVVRHGVRRCILKRFEEVKPLHPQKQLLPLEGEKPVEREVKEEVQPQPVYPRELQRRAWYAAKLASSVGALKENPSVENLNRLRNTAAQITERLGIPTGSLLEAAERYIKVRNDTAKMQLNEALTQAICALFSPLSLTPSLAEKRGKEKAAATILASTVEALEQKVNTLAEKVNTLISLTTALSSLEQKVEKLNVEQLAEEIAKRIPTTAIPRSKVKGLRKMLLEILSDGKERKSVEVQEELEKRFGVRASASSVAGRLSELAREGLIAKEKRGKEWYWRARSR